MRSEKSKVKVNVKKIVLSFNKDIEQLYLMLLLTFLSALNKPFFTVVIIERITKELFTFNNKDFKTKHT